MHRSLTMVAWSTLAAVGLLSGPMYGEQIWTVESGKTALFLNQVELESVGVSASLSNAQTVAGSDALNELNVHGSTLTVAVDHGVPTQFIGVMPHSGSLHLQAGGNEVVLLDTSLSISESANGTIVGITYGGPRKQLALIAQDSKIGYDHADASLFIESGDLTITSALANDLGAPTLEGLSIGGIRVQTSLIWVSGDENDGGEGGVAGGNNGTDCWNPGDPLVGPDVIVGVLSDMGNYSAVGGVEAFSVGTVSCNIGNQNLLWIAGNNQHPVIGQSMYRLKNGRFEHIGQSWLKHGFTALTLNDCGCGCSGQGGAVLGVGCSDPYGAGLNGSQSGLGPKNQVNAHNGFFIYPHDSSSGNSIYKRLQVRISDLDPAQNGGGEYFVEGQYVAPDDAAAGNQDNNASYRRITISGSGNNWNAAMMGTTQREKPAIRAWKDSDPTVQEVDVRVPNEGMMILASKVTDLGNGMWHYEYALQNVNSDRSAGSFTVPMAQGVTVTNVGFHDVDYHSGEPYMLADWSPATAGGSLSWATDPYSTNPNANALRWGTLYNFRFDADSEPTDGTITIGLFKPGTPTTVDVPAPVPALAIALAASFPPNGAIDARQPSNIDGTNPTGLQQIGLTFNGYALNLIAQDFEVTQEGSPDPAPSVLGLIPVTENTVNAVLSTPIRVGTWTTITHSASGLSTRIGYLPADANGDGTASPVDILALIDALNGVGTPLSIWSTDINRSGIAEPSDILRLIDLLNGAGEFTAYNGVSLP